MKTILASLTLLAIYVASHPAQTSGKKASHPGSLRAQTNSKLIDEVLAVKRQYDAAQLKNNGAWFERMFAEDYIFTLPDSTTLTRAQFIKELESRDIRWDSAFGEDMQARVYGDTAVVTGRFIGKGRYKGKPLDEHQRFTSVWVKREGRWQAICEHATHMPNPK